jgi:hypothetical protein
MWHLLLAGQTFVNWLLHQSGKDQEYHESHESHESDSWNVGPTGISTELPQALTQMASLPLLLLHVDHHAWVLAFGLIAVIVHVFYPIGSLACTYLQA